MTKMFSRLFLCGIGVIVGSCSNSTSFSGTDKIKGHDSTPTAETSPSPDVALSCAVEVSAKRLYTNFTERVQVRLKTGAAVTRASLDGKSVPAAGIEEERLLEPLLPSNLAAKEIAFVGEVFDSAGNKATCQEKIVVARADVSIAMEIKQSATADYANACSSGTVGVIAFTAKATHLFADESLQRFVVNPISVDLRLVECEATEVRKLPALVTGTDLFEHDIRCFYVNRASEAHLEYVDNIATMGFVGINLPTSKKNVDIFTTICQHPDDDADAPCEARMGRTLALGIKPTQTAVSHGMTLCPAEFPANQELLATVAPYR